MTQDKISKIRVKPIYGGFSGVPMMPIQREEERADLLRGEFGLECLKRYRRVARGVFNNNPVLASITYNRHGEVFGTNPYILALMNTVLEKSDEKEFARGDGFNCPALIRVATPEEIDYISKWQMIPYILGHLEKALLLSDEQEPNQYHARSLIRQIGEKQEIKFPLVIPYAALWLVPDENAPNGVDFRISERGYEDTGEFDSRYLDNYVQEQDLLVKDLHKQDTADEEDSKYIKRGFDMKKTGLVSMFETSEYTDGEGDNYSDVVNEDFKELYKNGTILVVKHSPS